MPSEALSDGIAAPVFGYNAASLIFQTTAMSKKNQARTRKQQTQQTPAPRRRRHD
ncbi:hypothetical protein AB9Q94_07190 [Neisseria gonorrhoeae]